jgi:hypothetical protein
MEKIKGTPEMFNLACNMFRGVRQNTNKSFIECWDEAVGLTNAGMHNEACNCIGWIFVYYVKLLLYEYAGKPGAGFEAWDKANHVYVNMKSLLGRRTGAVWVKGDVQCGRYALDKRDLPEECRFLIEKDDINDAGIMAVFDDIAYIIASLKLDLFIIRPSDDDDDE